MITLYILKGCIFHLPVYKNLQFGQTVPGRKIKEARTFQQHWQTLYLSGETMLVDGDNTMPKVLVDTWIQNKRLMLQQ